MNVTPTRARRRWGIGKTAGFVAISMIITFGTGVATAHADNLSANFSICGEQRRIDCVVDGDTFWFQRQKIRIADIDAPELTQPRCEAERQKGEAAKRRLLDMLNGGSFSLATVDRDEDRYGRKLRITSRGGRSLGDVLVREGLARRWDGPRKSWCD
jgi:endonuclease YncB( thermonuclease family)